MYSKYKNSKRADVSLIKEGINLKTEVQIINDFENDSFLIKKAANVIKEGGIVAFPTETVYGLGANALDEQAVKKIFEAKGRPQDNPLIIHVADRKLEKYIEMIPESAKKMMDKFWPGPLTIILKKKDIIPNTTSANLDTVGVRMPSEPIALKLIELSGVPIAAPSANISGRPSPTDVERCIEDLEGRVDFILGGDKSIVGVESTIVDCTVDPPMILRPGGITLEMLREIDGRIDIDKAILSKPTKDLKPKAPGMKYRHYAPKAKVTIISSCNKINENDEKVVEKINEMIQNYIEQGKTVGVLASEENSIFYKNSQVITLGSKNDLCTVAQNLFEALRSFDDKGVDIILSEAFEEKGLGIAVMNRLKKAAGYDIVNV